MTKTELPRILYLPRIAWLARLCGETAKERRGGIRNALQRLSSKSVTAFPHMRSHMHLILSETRRAQNQAGTRLS